MTDLQTRSSQVSREIAKNDTQEAKTILAEAYIDLSPKEFRALVDDMEKNESKNKIDIKSSFSGNGIKVETGGRRGTPLLLSSLPHSYPASRDEKFAELLRPQDHLNNEIATRALMNVAFRMQPDQGMDLLQSASRLSLSKSGRGNNTPYLKVSFVDLNKDGTMDNLGWVDIHTPPTKLPGPSGHQTGGALFSALLDGAGSLGTGSTTMFEYDFSSGKKWPPFNHNRAPKARTYDLKEMQGNR